nr:hypothetical protein [Tanacetum cinerariifolium]
MAQENYVEGCSVQRPPLLEPNGFCFCKAHFETYVKSNDIDLWQVIQNGDFYFELEDEETMLMKETPYELLKDNEKKQLSKNEEANMTIYNALPRKEYERVFMCKPPRREQTSDDSDSQRGGDEDADEEEAEAFNLLARNFRKFFARVIDSGAEIDLAIGLIDNWIMDSGCTKHMIGNKILFTSYNAYDGGHVVFVSNLKGKVVGVDCNVSKNGKFLAKGHRRNGLYTCKLGDNSKQ